LIECRDGDGWEQETMKLNYVAILAGLSTYCVLIVIHHWMTFGGPSFLLALFDEITIWDLYIQPLYSVVSAIAPGYVAGRIAKQHGLVHAGIVALLCALLTPLITKLYSGGGNYALEVYWVIITSGVLCTFSGLVGEYHAGRIIKRVNASANVDDR